MSQKKTISIIIPCHDEEENIQDIYREVTNLWQKKIKTYNLELIFVDDGSQDNTLLEIIKLNQKDDRVKFIEFSRNFGKEIATTAGIELCNGEACIMVDADLQYPINKIPEFIQKWEEGAEVVTGIRDKKQTTDKIEKIGSYLFYQIINIIGETRVIPGALDFRLLDKKVVTEFRKFTERGRMTRSLIDWLGFKQSFVFYSEKSRTKGMASYNLVKRVNLAIYTFISHSFFPLKLAAYLGFFIVMLGGFVGIVAFFNQFIFNNGEFNFSGPFLLGLLNSFLIGIVLICLGLVGFYIGNIHVEVVNRPLYIIRNMSGLNKKPK